MFALFYSVALLSAIGFSNAITFAEDANIEDYPYTVSVQFYKLHICGGVIVAKNFVLTAARCAYRYKPVDLKIRAGSTMRNGNDPIMQELNVTEIHVHDDFVVMGCAYDIAVLKLESDLVFKDYVDFIQLYAGTTPLPIETMGTVTGWGETTQVIGVYPQLLQKKNFMVDRTQWCEDQLNLQNGYPMSEESSFCARNIVINGEWEDGQPSMGDIGSAYAHIDPFDPNQTPTLVGIVSRPIDMTSHTIYTEITKVRDFIEIVTGTL